MPGSIPERKDRRWLRVPAARLLLESMNGYTPPADRGSPTMNPLQDQLEEARSLGRLEAERFDGSLREQELREREDRLSRLARGAAETFARGADGGESARVWRLQQEVERLAAFHQAVLRSRVWQVVQALRRPFGRAW
jgi:hypothetical protein